MRVYVAGPITLGDRAQNIRNGILAATVLMEMGHHPFVPHLSHFWTMVTPIEYERWMQYDFVWLAQCEALIRLPGPSAGSDREVAYAHEPGIPVYLGLDNFLKRSTDDFTRELGEPGAQERARRAV